MSSDFIEIEQKERPVECALCSVSSGMHAMYPLFDYHGPGGRQICVIKKSKNKSEKKLVWGHALCALYLASVGFMYACFKDGDYIGMGEEEDDADARPPNPELKITTEFQRRYGDAMPHFRYYLTPPNGAIDVWTKSVLENKRELKCIECGLADDKKSLRIPLQCVANDPDEFSEHKNKHRERNNDVAPCTQALHVGCARWGGSDPLSSVRKCYYFPGHTNPDGSIFGNVDTVHCLYCTRHAENVDENHQKLVRRDEATLEKKKLAGKERLEQKQQRAKQLQRAGSTIIARSQKKSPNSSPLPLSSRNPKRPVSMLKSTKIASKNTGNKPPIATSKASRARGKYKSREEDRHKELDPSMAVAINAGEQPTLAKRRQQIANDRSSVTKEDANQIFDDLVNHRDEIAQNPKSVFNGRKRFWKHEFSGLSTMDFDSIWAKARKRFFEYQSRKANLDCSDPSTRTIAELGSQPTSIYLPAPFLDTKERGKDTNARKRGSNNLSSDDDGVIETDYKMSNHEDAGRFKDDNIDQLPCKKTKKKETGEWPPDRWSKLFIGQPFEMGYEFTLDKIEKKN
jgi:hypothetical protein